MGQSTRPGRIVIGIVAAALLVSACGSRLPDETIEAIDNSLLNRSSGGSQVAAGEPSSVTDTGSTDTGAAVDAAPGTAGSGGTAPGGEAVTAAPGTPAGGGGGGAQAANCRPGTKTSPGVSPKEIKVASIVTDSGPLPGATEGSYRGAAAYFAMINAQGGVCGRKLTLLKGDDGLDPARARGEFLRLEPQVLAFVGAYSVADSGYVDQVEKTNVPYVSLFVDPAGRALPSAVPKIRDDTISTGAFVHWKRENPNVKKAAMLFSDVGGVRVNIEGSAKAIEKAGFELVEPPIPVGVADPDYTGHVRNLQDKGVEFVYLFAFEVNMHVRFARNMRQQNYDPPIKGSNIAFNDRFSKLLGEAGDGWQNYLEYLPFLDPGEAGRSPAAKTFLEWNGRVFPGAQLDLFNIAGWGRAAYFVEALRALGPDVDRATLLKKLYELPKYNGGGMEKDFEPSTGNSTPCFVMARHEGGAWRRDHPSGAGYECGVGEMFKFK